ncbi:SpoVG family protein [Acidobacteria bacterium AH-259-O06]|nr:SpoVG family protein [Acidobacteria bacterium AH-259-O06]
MNITVGKIKELDGTGSLKAFASIDIGGKLKIHGCRVIQQPGQKAWVSLPQREYIAEDGQKKWARIIELPTRVKDAVSEAILEAWERRQ